MSPNERAYFLERASLERELARSAPGTLLATLHLELAARYEAVVQSQSTKPELRLIVNHGWDEKPKRGRARPWRA